MSSSFSWQSFTPLGKVLLSSKCSIGNDIFTIGNCYTSLEFALPISRVTVAVTASIMILFKAW